jgi:flavin-dependent dehydrogenase
LAVWDDVEPVWWDSLRDPAGAGWHLDRPAFDQLLREAACAAGATLLEGCAPFEIERMSAAWSITFAASNTRHEAPVLIDATGRSRAVARRLGLKSYAQDDLLCMHTFLTIDSVMDEDATTCVCADEYGWWYTVQTPHQQRVLAYHVDVKKSPWRQWRNPVDFFAHARRHPLLADRIQALQPASLHYRAAGTSVLDISGLSHTPGFLAIGDAVLAFDPISSQGIFHSLASAESAAKAIRADFHLNRSALNDFQNEMQSVSSRYLYHLKNTYRGPKRFAQYDFWAKRCDALYSSNQM